METTSSIVPPASSTPVPHTLPLGIHTGYPAFLSASSNDLEPAVLLDGVSHGMIPLRALDRFTDDHRGALANAVLHDLHKWDAPDAALAAAETLRAQKSYAVVTGQQAGIAGGPLYTLYKAVGAVKAAAQLAELDPDHRFVPVFWIEADDHDFAEASTIPLLDRTGNARTVAYADGDERPLHVGDRPNNADGLAALVAELREILPPTEFADDALRIITDSYRTGNGETLADGFARALYAMLGDTPLVVASSRNPALKRLAADIFERQALAPEPMLHAIEDATTKLAERSLPTPITPKLGGLFITHDGERRSLVPEGNDYLIKGTDQRMSRDDVARIAQEHPERLSPNVMLRPIVQDAIFPTAVYLGGPSEIAYLRQILPAFAGFGMEPSAVAPRPFVLIVEPKVRRLLESGECSLEMLVGAEFDAAAMMVDATTVDELEKARSRAAERLREAFAELEIVTRRIDPTLEKTLGSAEVGAAKGVDDLAKRLHSALKKRQQTGIDRLNSARAMILPGNAPQERNSSPLYFIAKYGLDRFRQVLDGITLESGVVQVVGVG